MPYDRGFIRFLAEKMMGWKPGWESDPLERDYKGFNPVASWADFGMVWETALAAGKSLRLYSSPHTPQSTAVVHTPETNELPVVVADDDPKRAVCMAVAKAFGWKEEAHG